MRKIKNMRNKFMKEMMNNLVRNNYLLFIIDLLIDYYLNLFNFNNLNNLV